MLSTNLVEKAFEFVQQQFGRAEGLLHLSLLLVRHHVGGAVGEGVRRLSSSGGGGGGGSEHEVARNARHLDGVARYRRRPPTPRTTRTEGRTRQGGGCRQRRGLRPGAEGAKAS